MAIMKQDDLLRAELAHLRQEHRALDRQIEEIDADSFTDRLALQRLKKRRLGLKDRITRLQDQITPDIIA
ncbi:MAG: DUF465 domain-containing protein [Pseudomonadota bacterium]